MADVPVVHIGENSPEQIAFRLLQIIASNEQKSIGIGNMNGFQAGADRKWLLDTYVECLQSVTGKRPIAR